MNDETLGQPEGEPENDGGMTDEAAVAELLRQGAEANPDEQEGADASGEGAIEGEDAQPETPKRKVKVGDDELDEDEVIAGYMKDRDYRQKTTAVAEKERAVQAQYDYVQQELATRVTHLDATLALMQRELLGDQQELAGLLESNPHEYLKRQQQLQGKQQAFAQAVQQRQAYDQMQQQQAASQQAAFLATQRTHLAERLPSWKDPAKAAAEQREIADVLTRHYGYKPDELSELQDARALLLARDAMLYHKSLGLAKAKPAAAPAAVRAGAAPTTPGNERDLRDLTARAKRTGRDEDAVAVLLARNKR